jgi:very-short-patch-repair endonuclease
LNQSQQSETGRPSYIPYNIKLKERCRKMRKNPTNAEKALWRILRSGELAELTFNRQKPLGNYIVDFYCSKAQLVVEADGSGHAKKDQKEYDEERTAFLEGWGLKVLRFWNNEILENPEGVYKTILSTIQKQQNTVFQN